MDATNRRGSTDAVAAPAQRGRRASDVSERPPPPPPRAREGPRRRSMDMGLVKKSSVPSMVFGDSMTSLVSEMTMATYSEEKAEALQEEFFRRAGQGPNRLADMSEFERADLLAVVQGDVEAEFQRMKRQEKEAKRRMEETRDGFQRWRAGQEPEEGPEEETKEREKSHGEAGDLLTRFRALKQSETMRQQREHLAGRRGSPTTQSVRAEAQKGGLVQSFSSMATAKVNNTRAAKSFLKSFSSTAELSDPLTSGSGLGAIQDYKIEDQALDEGGGDAEPLERQRANPLSALFSSRNSGTGLTPIEDYKIEDQAPDEEGGDTEPPEGEGGPRGSEDEGSEPASVEPAGVEQIIELKLQVANQQATIDALSSKLRNVELANRQLLRELRRANQAKSKPKPSGEEAPQASGDGDLARENAELRRQMVLLQDDKMRLSEHTASTDPSTEADPFPHNL